jgi:hypothetical protein
MNILNISSTPLVGSPYNLNKALKLLGYNAHLVYISDYPKVKSFFPKPDFYFKEFLKKKNTYDLAICHNILNIGEIDKILDFSKKNVLILHSSIYDGPIYQRFYLENIKKKFDTIFSLSQGHSRFYPETKLYNNIVFDHPPNQDLDFNNKLNICSTFSLSSEGRFGSKNPNNVIEDLKNFFKKNNDKFKYHEISNISQREVRRLRSYMHINIDDLYTGAFHQVSLEAVGTGGLAINGADMFTILNFKNAIKVNEQLPFINCCNVENCINKIFELFFHKKKLIERIKYSRDFYLKYLNPQRLTNIFLSSIYND